MSIIYYPSAAPPSLLRTEYTGSSVFEDPIVSTTSRNGLSQTAIIILVSTIPIVSCLAIIFGIVHIVRRRNERILQARRQADVDWSLMSMDVGRINETSRIGMLEDGDGPSVPVPERT